MLHLRSVLLILPVGLALSTGVVFGQDYPNKPIRMITASPGGGSDFVARVVSQEIAGPLGQPVIVDNRGGIIPGEIVAKASPDGYTLLVDSASFWIAPLLQQIPYDVVKEFSPITLVTSSPIILVLHPSVPVKSVKELITLAKAKPGHLNYGSGASGASSHLAPELFKSMAGVNIVRITYKGSGPAVAALVAGEVQLMVASAPSVAPHLKSGKLRALAVTSAKPSPLFPGLPPIAETLPGYETVTNTGVFAPAKTPAAVIKRLNQEMVRVLNRSDVKEKFFNAGSEVVASSPEQFAASVKAEIAMWGKLIREAGIKAD